MSWMHPSNHHHHPKPSVPPIDQYSPSTPIAVELIEAAPEDVSAVEAMQQLLLKHEKTDLHRVEDPDLERVLKELRNIGHSNIIDVFTAENVMQYIGVDDDGNDVYNNRQRITIKDLHDLPREVTACIQQLDVKHGPEGDTIRVKMYDKQIALDKLMKFHGAYMRDNEQQAKDHNHGVMDLLLASIGAEGLPERSRTTAHDTAKPTATPNRHLHHCSKLKR